MPLPTLGTLYHGGHANGLPNGLPVWTQPGGAGTPVSPPAPTLYPIVPQGYPQAPFCYQGLYVLGCGHWINEPELYTEFDSTTGKQAALCCCPVCSYIQLIVEPADQWWEQWYGLYNTGLAVATLPTFNE